MEFLPEHSLENQPLRITCGLWQTRTEFLRTHCVNVPRKAIHLNRPKEESSIWELAGNFILGLEKLQSHGDTYKRTVCFGFCSRSLQFIKRWPQYLQMRAIPPGSCCLWLHLFASKCCMTHFPQQTFHETRLQEGVSGEHLRGSSQTTMLLFAKEGVQWYLDQLTKITSNGFL